MVARNAEAIFDEFQHLRDGNDPRTPEEQLERYCRDTLTTVEGLHFDYKCKQNSQTPQLEESDKRNLAKAVSGFANSGGGVLLWGIKEGPPLKLVPITQVETFLKRLLELGGQATDPTVQGLQGASIPSRHDPTAGYAAILVPESPLPPHRVVLKIQAVQNHYYLRTGSDFLVAPHTQLEDMFGRRPRPNLVTKIRGDFIYNSIASRWQIVFDVINEGRGTAKEVYFELLPQPGMGHDDFYSGWRHVPGTHEATTGHESWAFVLGSARVIHPGMAISFTGIHLKPPDFVPGQGVKFDCTLYCEGCAPVKRLIQGRLQPS
jgi:hypothetical protein